MTEQSTITLAHALYHYVTRSALDNILQGGGGVTSINSVLPPVTRVKNFDHRFSALTLDLLLVIVLSSIRPHPQMF